MSVKIAVVIDGVNVAGGQIAAFVSMQQYHMDNNSAGQQTFAKNKQFF